MDYIGKRWSAEGGYRQALHIAIPLIFSSAGMAIQQFVNRMFLAWYSPEAIAASMPAGLINFTFLNLFIGTAGYVSIFVAQYWGAQLHDRIGPILWQGFYVAIIAALVNLLFVPLAGPFFTMIGHPSGVQRLEIIYFKILCFKAGLFISFAGISVFLLLIGRLGTIALAATNIALNINLLAFMPMMGVGMAVMTLVGQYQGKKRADLAEKSVYSCFHLTNLYMITLAALYVIIPELFLWPFGIRSDPGSFAQIEKAVIVLLRFVAIYSLFDGFNIVFASGVKGAGDTRFVLMMIFGLSLFGLALPAYMAMVPFRLGLMAAWTIMTIYVILLSFAFLFRFLSGKWKTMLVIDTKYKVESKSVL
ncbi:MAG: MATE family efflux transporter [Deltaproteobacteria bacterium]|nr:MATE family efflux transporter [Deltaproteobacteria bacterium]